MNGEFPASVYLLTPLLLYFRLLTVLSIAIPVGVFFSKLKILLFNLLGFN